MELKSCPFCDQTELEILKIRKGHSMSSALYALWHKPRNHCGLSNEKLFISTSPEKVAQFWNTRHSNKEVILINKEDDEFVEKFISERTPEPKTTKISNKEALELIDDIRYHMNNAFHRSSSVLLTLEKLSKLKSLLK